MPRPLFLLLAVCLWSLSRVQGTPTDTSGFVRLRRVEPLDRVTFGRLESWEGFDFGSLLPRRISVWLPPAPYWDGQKRLPVWYIHDGQNLWDPLRGYGGQTWNLDSLMEWALSQGRMEPCVLVALDNTRQRFQDYLPPPCWEGLTPQEKDSLRLERAGDPQGDTYARWLVRVLQPWVTLQYPVDLNLSRHYLMGASMGGLISSYTAVGWPEHFGGAACLSTHWPLSLQRNRLDYSEPYRQWLIQNLTKKPSIISNSNFKENLHSLYMDHGDQTLDAFYPPHQEAFDTELHQKGLPPGIRYRSLAFPGTAHTEMDWSKRCVEAMAWVMKGQKTARKVTKPPPASAWSMYFALTDRMADGDSTNNHAIPGTYDPTKAHYHHGGDWEGLRQKIPYLKSLGINALWITPPVLNQNFNPDSTMTGYHGYWASDFQKTDPRWGSRRDYRRLARDLNRNGIALIQDVVVNHTGDYFEVDSQGLLRHHNQDRPQQRLLRRSQSPSVYHRLPTIDDFRDSLQRLQGQMSGLDDLSTENPRLRRSLRRIYRRWVRWGQLRGMRMDTPLYVEEDFWKDFLHRRAWWDPGLKRTAQRKGLDFWTFGECWTHSEAWSDHGEARAATYIRPGQGMDAALQFPLQKTILEVLNGTRGSAHLTYRLEAQRKHFPNPSTRIQFLDNHDMPRMGSRLDSLGQVQALVLLYTLPGVPVLYYGTEFGTAETRYSMLHTNPEYGPFTPIIRQLNSFRAQYPNLHTTEPVVLVDSRTGHSAWVALVGERWLVALNPGKQAVNLPFEDLAKRLGPGWTLLPRPAMHHGGLARIDSSGWTLEPGETWVWGIIPPPENLHPPKPLQVPFPLPQSLDSWLDGAKVLAEINDPAKDDSGSNGNLTYPKAFEGNPGDLAGLRWLYSPSGGYILEIRMHGPLSRVWNPPHGLDHLHLAIDFEEISGNSSAKSLSYTLNGWSATGERAWEWYTRPQEGKIYAVFGPKAPMEPFLKTSTGETSQWFLRVRTWDVDGDGQLRPLRPSPGLYEFGGDPVAERWMDQIEMTLSGGKK